MQNKKRIYLLSIILLFSLLNTAHITNAFADEPDSICRRLPATPEPQTASTLRLFTAYAMPTLVTQFGAWATETDDIYQKTRTNNQVEIQRNFARVTRPFHWEISLFWNISRRSNEHNLTPLTEAYRHQEYRLREAYRICNALRRYPLNTRHDIDIYNLNHTESLNYLLTKIEEQRTAALLRIYVPKSTLYPNLTPSKSTVITGVLP